MHGRVFSIKTSSPASPVDSMNGLLQQAKRAARGHRTAKDFIAIAHLRLSRLKNLPLTRSAPLRPFW